MRLLRMVGNDYFCYIVVFQEVTKCRKKPVFSPKRFIGGKNGSYGGGVLSFILTKFAGS